MKNFKDESYPESIEVVIQDMQSIITEVNRQLYMANPHHLKDFLSFGKRNRINKDLFSNHFDFNSDNVSMKNKDIKGVYVLAEEKEGKIEIVNVGISKTIMRRLKQHTCGKMHNESTLGFYMALNHHKNKIGINYSGKRALFPYDNYRDNMFNYIRNLRFAIVPIDNNFELYMVECYLACHYKTFWNTFETH
jgi:hypothetical protein